MTDQTSIIPADLLSKPDDKGSLELFKSITKAGDWLARLQLFGSNSKATKKGLIPAGHWGRVGRKDDITDLGEQISAVPVDWRPLALSFADPEHIINIYDQTDPQFVEIQKLSFEKDSECVFGPQFLLWIPSEKEFLLYHMNSKTARSEASKLLKQIGKHAIFKVKLIETAKYTWEGPQILGSPIPVTNLPDTAVLKRELEQFRNPPKQEVEEAPEEAGTEGAGRER